MMTYLETKLNEVRARGEGVLSISLAPNGVREFDRLLEPIDYLLGAGMNQLLIISYLPTVQKLCNLAPAEQRFVNRESAKGSYQDMVFDNLAAIHAKHPDLPLITTPMLGDMIAYGQRRYVERAIACGVVGWDTCNYTTIPDPTGIRRMVQEKGAGFLGAVWSNMIDINRPEDRKLIRDTVVCSSGELFVVPAVPGSSDGLDGRYVKPVVDYIREVQDELGHRYPLIGIGGIATAKDAYEMVKVAGVDGVHFSSGYMKRVIAGQSVEEITAFLRDVKDAMRG